MKPFFLRDDAVFCACVRSGSGRACQARCEADRAIVTVDPGLRVVEILSLDTNLHRLLTRLACRDIRKGRHASGGVRRPPVYLLVLSTGRTFLFFFFSSPSPFISIHDELSWQQCKSLKRDAFSSTTTLSLLSEVLSM